MARLIGANTSAAWPDKARARATRATLTRLNLFPFPNERLLGAR